jgi:phosphatidylglycerophosphate synthase
MNPWRERLHRWLAPAARHCPLSPNGVTLLALAINIAAAVLLYRRWFLTAMVLLAIGGLADAFDGVVARVQEKVSRYGDFLDHFADRVSDVLILTGWLLGNAVRAELAIAAIIVVLLNGYLGTQLEASWGKRDYDSVGRGEFVLGLVVYPIVSTILYDNVWDAIALRGLRIADWMAVLVVAFALLGITQRLVIAAKLERTG